MPIPRFRLVDPKHPGPYHCISRCVRRAFLCGDGYEHRRAWIRDRMADLTEIFAIDVIAFAVMSNHLHVLLWTDPERAEYWSADEVARRWLRLCPKPIPHGMSAKLAVRQLAGNERLIRIYRERLASLSWFMKALKEPIARRANAEDECTGAFWEGRFKCYRVVDEAGVLTCAAYIDLNAIHAGVAEMPEDSEFTSVWERIKAWQANGQRRRASNRARPRRKKDQHDCERPAVTLGRRYGTWLAPMSPDPTAPGRRVIFGFGVEKYLQLIDSLGRIVRGDKHGAIPRHLRPILDRLELDVDAWIHVVTAHVRRLWGSTVGRSRSLASEAVRRKQTRVANPLGPIG
jgi:REP element-mobilizing transposase RayT